MIHSTAVCIHNVGVLLAGKSGSGKSDLALRLLDRGAQLICDDYVEIAEINDAPVLRPAPNIAGKIEVRGLGILPMYMVDSAPLRLYVDLEMQAQRHPVLWPTQSLRGFLVPKMNIAAFEASAPIKIEMALDILIRDAIFPQKMAGK